MIQITLPDGAQTHDAPVRGAEIAARSGDVGADKALALRTDGVWVETDLRNEKIGYKIREHSLAKVPVLLVVGKREAKDGTISLRRLGCTDTETLTLREALVRLETEALRSTRAPVSFPNESPSEDKERLAEAVAG